MPTLRDHVRKTLSAREPTEAEASADLDALLARRRTRPRLAWPVYGVLVVGAAAIAVWLARPKPIPLTTTAPTSPSAGLPSSGPAGVHLYLHIAGEPESQAVALDLTSQGDRP